MKKLICLCMAVMMLFVFTACDAEPTKEAYNPDSTPIVETNKKTTFGINETAVFENLKISATEIQVSNGVDYFTPEEGNVFVGVKFVIENISQETQGISSLLLFEGYVDDVKCDYSFSAACAFDEGTLDGDIASGKKMVGWYALEVPAEWSSIELVVQPDLLASSSATFVFENTN